MDDEVVEVKQTDEYDDDYDDERFSKKKSTDFCLMCQARLKNAADKGQKNPKPM
jgi:hypothetical protein